MVWTNSIGGHGLGRVLPARVLVLRLLSVRVPSAAVSLSGGPAADAVRGHPRVARHAGAAGAAALGLVDHQHAVVVLNVAVLKNGRADLF